MDKLFIRFLTVHGNRENNVLPDVQGRDQIIVLKNKTDPATAEHRKLFFIQARQFCISDGYCPGCGGVKAAQHIQQGGLAGAGSTDNGNKLSGFDLQIYAVQGMDFCFPFSVIFFQVFCL